MSADEGKPRRRLSDEERKLWGHFTRSVAPLRRPPVPADLPPAAASKTKSATQLRVVARAAPAARTAAGLEPFDRRLKKRLARGTEPIDARIDLHGKTQSEAHAALISFLRKAQSHGAKFVLVITGKGGGVLKRQVPQWLKLPEFRGYVLGFEDAHLGHGGAGALYVRIRRGKAGTRRFS